LKIRHALEPFFVESLAKILVLGLKIPFHVCSSFFMDKEAFFSSIPYGKLKKLSLVVRKTLDGTIPL
jgi:hypothetical protein